MGQPIEVQAQIVGDIAIFDTDRSITGQDGVGFDSAETARTTAGLPARLAVQLLEGDAGLRHVFFLSNTVSARREGGWPEEAQSAAVHAIEQFFLFYRDDGRPPGGAAEPTPPPTE